MATSATNAAKGKHLRVQYLFNHVFFPTKLPNAMQYAMYDAERTTWLKSAFGTINVRTQCTFELIRGPFKELQFALDSVNHTSNDVVAWQHLCPTEMSLNEYYSFCILRAGHRLQWRNIIRELVNGALDFARFETHQLVVQAAWQVEGQTNPECSIRDSHVDLEEDAFATHLLVALEGNLRGIAENWQGASALLTFASLAAQALSLSRSDSVQEACLRFLSNARYVAHNWISLISTIDDHATQEDEEAAAVRARLLEVAFVCQMTYAVDASALPRVIASETDVAILTECTIFVHDLSSTDSLSPGGRLRLLSHRSKRMIHSLESALRQHILANPAGLDRTIKKRWASYKPGKGWTVASPSHQRYLQTKTTPEGSDRPAVVQYDLLTGRLLVNGNPISKLPGEYTSHPTYRRLFGGLSLEVYPSTAIGAKFQSRNRYHGHQLYFNMTPGGRLVIRVIGDGSTHELIPPQALEGDFPHVLVRNYVHWLQVDTNEVIWLPISSPWAFDMAEWRLRRGLMGASWLQNGNMRLIDVRSKAAQAVLVVLQPLDAILQLRITYNTETKEICIHMPRFGLDFTREQGGYQIKSRQFPGFSIDEDQNLGTFSGLENKLMLRKTDGARLVIIPHGSITHWVKGHHIHAVIDTSSLDTVRYYTYEVDVLLHRLVDDAKLVSKLYRCYLHAVTSYCLPDGLTHRTGTEEALAMLSNPGMKSYTSINPEELTLLKAIEQLSPRRMYYPQHLRKMQQVHWSQLPAHSQHPSFCKHVKSIVDQVQLLDLFSTEPSKLQLSNICEPAELLMKAEIRDSQLRAFDYGAQNHTRVHDRAYESRDKIENSDDAEVDVVRTTQAVDSWSPELAVCQKLLHTMQDWGSGIPPASGSSRLPFGYHEEWLDMQPSTLAREWSSLKKYMSGAHPGLDKYAILIMLSTMTYSRKAQPMLVGTLLAFATDQQLRGLPLEPSATLVLSDGYILDRKTLVGIVHATFRHDSQTPAHWLQRRGGETKRAWAARKRQDLMQNRANHTNSLIDTLMSQRETRTALSFTSEGAQEYLNVADAVEGCKRLFLSWECNAAYSEQMVYIQARLGVVRPVERTITHYVFEKPPYQPQIRQAIFGWADAMKGHPPTLLAAAAVNFDSWVQPTAYDRTQDDKLHALLTVLKEQDATHDYESDYVQYLQGSFAQRSSRLQIKATSRNLLLSRLPGLLEERTTRAHEAYRLIRHCFTMNSTNGLLPISAESYLRLSNSTILQLLASNSDILLNNSWKRCLVQYGVILSELQHIKRLSKCATGGMSGLEAELVDCNHTHWSPLLRPDWLLFELENNLMIRKSQTEVAEAMIAPKDDANSIMQLNMGEGKSSVITPIIATTLADGKTQLLRIIVLKPLAKQMLSLLVQKLGGMLRRRIFHLPISRSVRLDVAQARQIQTMCEEALKTGGIVLLQPEHILSFRLMAIELTMSDSEVGGVVHETNQWLQHKSRDVLDESDEILGVRLELIYAMGMQQSVDYSPDRWIIIQKLLDVLRKIARDVSKRLPDGIQIVHQDRGGFPRIRVLTEGTAGELIQQIAGHIYDHGLVGLPSWKLKICPKEAVLSFLIDPCLAIQDRHPQIRRLLETDNDCKLLLLLRGLLVGGIVSFVLSKKRWRVNYGLDLSRTRLAVPYRGKDVPSPRSEFSHIDVALITTCLSYYYGSLSDNELDLAFEQLVKLDNAAEEYLCWTECLPSIPESCDTLPKINLSDPRLKTTVFPHLRQSKGAIDFYLCHIVFPKEMKEFPSKLSSSGWDLAVQKSLPTTGFSGTNDSRYLLPTSITQQDLAQLGGTNAGMLNTLLRPDNSFVALSQANSTGDGEITTTALLQTVVSMSPAVRVILDVGAQILDMSNREVSSAWLELLPANSTKAVVFFDKDNELSVLDRDGYIESLSSSPFGRQIDQCLVYLDESHTRGTDLKLPNNYRAAVTLGPALFKDKLTQACARMRKLLFGQSLVFVSPDEVTRQILQSCNKHDVDSIAVADVLRWSIKETWHDTESGYLLWDRQRARHEWQQTILQEISDTQAMTSAQANRLLEPEAQTIEQRYESKRPNVDVSQG